MKIQYNSPVILTFSLICTAVLILSSFLGDGFKLLFTVTPDMSVSTPSTYFRLFSHVLGHANWHHWLANASLLLLIGPVVEEKYGGRDLVIMILFTAFITGVLQLTLFSDGLLGASGIVFMLILLSSFTNFSQGKIPLTFIIVALLYIGGEIVNSINATDHISQFAHIIGGICGSGFGFWLGKNDRRRR